MAEPTKDKPIDPRVERTRSAVLDAVMELLAECGFDGITIEGIADRSGVARSTIYRHWPDRLDLLTQAIQAQELAIEPADTGSLRADLLAWAEPMCEAFVDPCLGGMVASLMAEARRDVHLAALYGSITRHRLDHAVTVVERAKARGELPAETDAVQFADDLAAPLFFRAFVTHQSLDAAFVTAHIDRWIALYRGVAPTEPAVQLSSTR